MSKPRSLLLVDGSSYLYRAYHALPPLTSSQGEPTGAVYGVLNMLHKLIRDEQPELLAVVMDAPGKTFRDELYAEYKANRPPMPDDLRQQVEPLTEAIEALGLPLIRIAGVEADDVIGTLATQAAQGKLSTVISTGDKDMAQLVSERITLLDTMPRGTSREPRAMDAAGVLEKFQVRADQIVDYLALVGDSSDNIPGVPKVGAKTAVALLAEFDSVDDILTNLDAVAELPIRGAKGLAERIAANSDVLQLSRRLATIKCDVVLDRTPDELVPVAPDLNKLRELYRRLELNRLLKTLPEEQATTTAPENTIYETILSDTQLDEWLVKIEAAELVAFDTETTSIDYMEAELVGLSFAVEEGQAAYLPVAHCYEGAPKQLDREYVLEQLKPWLEDASRSKVGHHLKYDAHILENHGVTLRGMRFDSMLESYVLNSTATRHDMNSTAHKYLNLETIRFEDVAGKGAGQLRFDQVDLDRAAPYAAEDADITLRLHRKLWPMLEATGSLAKLYTSIEQPLVPVLQRIEHRGVLVDEKRLAKQSTELTKKIAALEKKVHKEAGRKFNLGSPKQLQELLFDELGLPVIRKDIHTEREKHTQRHTHKERLKH